LDTEPDFASDHPSSWDLLKSFDRAFWISVCEVEEENQNEAHTPSPNGCPFSNPLLTQSFGHYDLEFSGDTAQLQKLLHQTIKKEVDIN